MAKNVKLKKGAKRGIILLVLLIILSVVGVKYYKEYLYKQTYEYKLLEHSYKLEDTKILIKNLKNKELDEILSKDYNDNIVKLVSEKYFIYKNIDRYLSYIDKKDTNNITNVISMVNVNRDRAFYDESIKTNIDNKELILVNKYYNLSEDYEPDNITNISLSYAYEGNSLNETALSAFKELSNSAKDNGYTILINSSYRDYNSQKEVWESRKDLYGTRKADEYAARPGHSEHQSGYAIDVADFYDENDKFGDTESYIWMKDNCYRFGFILRYPQDKEDITGYSFEPWHYRYVGTDVASTIKNEKITFDEYYAFYIDNK